MHNPETIIPVLERQLTNLRSEYQEFVSAISHDLSATFRQTKGFSQIILKDCGGEFDEKTKHHFGFVLDGVDKGKTIIDGLREFSHLSRKNAPFAEFDSQQAIAEVLELFESWIESSDAAIKVQKLPKITGDKEQIKIVFFHLLKNALLYRSNSVRPEIIVSCEEQKEHWEFTVSDNGIGVPGNMDERIFQVLKRAVADNDYPGHGMGLATAKKVITRHGGTIGLRRGDTALTLMAFTIPKHPIDI